MQSNKNTLTKILSFYYDFTEMETNLLIYLARNGAKTVNELAKELGFSAPLINRYLDRLYEKGFIKRIKDTTDRSGRPRYVYMAASLAELRQRLIAEIRQTNEDMIELIEKEFI